MIVVLVYIYLLHQWKRNDNLEVFEMDYVENHAHLQEACDLRQPILFPMAPPEYHTVFPAHAHGMDICIKDARDYASGKLDFVDMSLERSLAFLAAAPSHYFSEGNGDFLAESGVLRHYRADADGWFKPAFTLSSHYDCILGNATATPYRHHTHYRRFLWVLTGSLCISLVPWKSMSRAVKNYEHYEFYATSPPPATAMTVTVPAGHVLYVPPYWWYSLGFCGGGGAAAGETIVLQCSYVTPMNAMAHLSDLLLYYLEQSQKENVVENINADKTTAFEEKEDPKVSPPLSEDVHCAESVGHAATGQSVPLEHDVVQPAQGDGRAIREDE